MSVPDELDQLRAEQLDWLNASRRRVRTLITQIVGAAVVATLGLIVTQNRSVAYAFGLEAGYFSVAGALSTAALAGFACVAGLRLFLDYGGSLRYLLHSGTEFTLRLSENEHSTPIPAQPSGVVEAPKLLSELLTRELRYRLRGEVVGQGRKASTNLAVGASLALVGAGFIVWLALDAAAIQSRVVIPVNPMTYWGALGSKLALSTTANVFAFFFLATYRRNLSEIKYFQNELTNVESRAIAVALCSERDGAVSDAVIASLLNVERNFVLRRGETTADLSLKNLDQSEIQALAALLSQTLDTRDRQQKAG
jgi:hypothetical protein